MAPTGLGEPRRLGSTRLHWLRTGPTRPSPAAVKAELAKLAFLRGLDAHQIEFRVLPSERRRFLATIGRRSTAQALARREPDRRFPILLTLLAQCAIDVLDEVVQLYDQAVSATDHRAERKLEEKLAAPVPRHPTTAWDCSTLMSKGFV
jgi:hypothetical protein